MADVNKRVCYPLEEVVLYLTEPELPMYATEVRFYRKVLAISSGFGSALRRPGALVPDAVPDDGRALFQLTPEKLEAARSQVFLLKAHQLKSVETV